MNRKDLTKMNMMIISSFKFQPFGLQGFHTEISVVRLKR